MHRSGLTELEIVVAVSRRRSFRAAARELGMSATAVSNAVAGLENRLQARLFNRSTRSVALTDTGQRYVERIAPALAEILQANDEIHSEPDKPSGTLRINAPPEVAMIFFQPLLREYAERYPAMRIEVVTEPRMIDIVAEGFDAGIRLAEDVPLDMISVPLTGPVRQVIVGSPAYLVSHGKPDTPSDLLTHRGILMRMASGHIYRWELEKNGQKIESNIPPRLVFSEISVILEAARAGLGLAFLAEWFIAEDLANGRLVKLLDDWCQPFPGLCLYYPGRRHVPVGLRALIKLIRSAGTEAPDR